MTGARNRPTETNVSRAFPHRWVTPAEVLTVIFNGQPVEVRRMSKRGGPKHSRIRNRKLSEIMDEAAKASGNEQYWLGQQNRWEARDMLGRLLDPAKVLPKLHWDCPHRVYVNLRPGVGA